MQRMRPGRSGKGADTAFETQELREFRINDR